MRCVSQISALAAIMVACTRGKNADSIKKEDRVYLGGDEQAAHRWSAYRPISKSVQVAFFGISAKTPPLVKAFFEFFNLGNLESWKSRR
jgi:hypothetical protein